MSARPPVLPLALLVFATGVLLLQWQPALPPVLPWIGFAAVAAAGSLGVRVYAGPARAARGMAMVLAAMTAGTLGFAYAAWRADMRLADALPPAWEGEDITLVGVIDELPQRSDHGTRFAFAVERIETPGAIVPGRLSLAWYAQWQKGGPIDPVPDLVAGERWRLFVRLKRPHGSVNPHGFDVEAWLLQNGLRATGHVRSGAPNARLDAFAGRAGRLSVCDKI